MALADCIVQFEGETENTNVSTKSPVPTEITEEITEPEQQKKIKMLRMKKKVDLRKTPTKLLKKPSSTITSNKDECAIFGEYIAKKLKILDNRNRAIAQHRINNIFFELEMSLYTVNSQNSFETQPMHVPIFP